MAAGKTRRKHTRENRQQRERARRLVALWYLDRCERREERYRAVNQKPVLVQTIQQPTVERWPRQPWDRPLTADGKETLPPPTKPGLRVPIDTEAAGNFKVDADLRFASKVMLHVITVEPASHCALEMDAAGYTVEGIADELGCGERLARDFLGDGLAVVRSCLILRKDLEW